MTVDAEKELIYQSSNKVVRFFDFTVMLNILLKSEVEKVCGVKIKDHFTKKEEVQLVDSHGNELEGQFRLIERLYLETEFGTFSDHEFYRKFVEEENDREPGYSYGA